MLIILIFCLSVVFKWHSFLSTAVHYGNVYMYYVHILYLLVYLHIPFQNFCVLDSRKSQIILSLQYLASKFWYPNRWLGLVTTKPITYTNRITHLFTFTSFWSVPRKLVFTSLHKHEVYVCVCVVCVGSYVYVYYCLTPMSNRKLLFGRDTVHWFIIMRRER